MLDGVFGDVSGVGGGSAGHHDDLVDRAQHRLVDAQLVEVEPAAVARPAAQSLGHGARLLVDLLVHEGLVAALDGRRDVPVDLEALALGGRAVEVDDRDILGSDADDRVLAEFQGLVRVADEGRHVRAEEVLPPPQADDERRVAPGGHYLPGVLAVDADEREGSLQARGEAAHSGQEVAVLLQLEGQVVSGYLGVGLGGELDAPAGELFGELPVVLDDPVVDDGHPAVEADMGVSVDIGGTAVGRPPGVADRRLGGRERRGLQRGAQIVQSPGLLGRAHPLLADDGDARAVVPAVFEEGQALENHVKRARACRA